MNTAYIVAPIVGSFIGYITNYVAIKMLFRPIKPKYIFGLRIPFTPGIIPREKDRLAKNTGYAVGNGLLTDDIIENTLKSDMFKQKLESLIDNKLEQVKYYDKNLMDLLANILDQEKSTQLISYLRNNISSYMYNELNSPETMKKIEIFISQSIEDYVKNQSKNPIVKILLKFNNSIISSIQSNITSKIKKFIYFDSKPIIENIVNKEIKKILDRKINTFYDILNENSQEIKKTSLKNYEKLLSTENIGKFTSALDISSMVENKINQFDLLEGEKFILSVINKELKAIIWLGALLGLVVGFLTPILSSL